jgi:hypothetical protein
VVRTTEETWLKGFQEALLTKLGTHFANLLEDHASFMWTLPLDPRLIHMGGLSEAERESVRATLQEKVTRRRLDNNNHGTGTAHVASPSNEYLSSLRMAGIFWGDDKGCSNEAVATVAKETSSTTMTASTYAKSNVERYFSFVTTSAPIPDPLGWWKVQQHDFPELAALAREWLAVSCIGPPRDGRSIFEDTHLELAVFLHDNLAMLSQNYD